jgi:hypothetical protein
LAPRGRRRTRRQAQAREFAADKEGAEKKYEGKVLVVEGVVTQTKSDDANSFYTYTIAVAGPGGKAEVPVRVEAVCLCAASKRLAGYHATVRPGQKVTVKGEATGLLFDERVSVEGVLLR